MNRKKAKTAAIALTLATVIALSGTFAWQSISQMAQNEATEPTNPGGRLHDDFSGYGAADTKDIYVENFGSQPIYARVRLDEYMEIGEGAGLKGTVDEDGAITPNPENQAVPLVTGAEIDDVTTWTTHIPGNAPDAGAETDFTDPSKTFHTYWTWTMGGQAADNPEGKTVYMPTFNKNRDSLKADINGTLAGLDKDPEAGDPYDDYHKFTTGETAIRVRDTDTTTHPNGATYDIDEDTTDECGPYGGAGGTGVEGVNYGLAEETHTAQETMNSSVITMAEYKTKTEAQKAEFQGWVYDKDGWAYWSQPIQPGTPTEEDKFVTNATGLLLDRIVLEHKPSDTWYYSINAVGQFITADDLGRTGEPQTGFYDPNGGPEPSEDALALLDFIGVDIASVKGAITPVASVTVGDAVKPLTYAVQGMSLDLSSAVTVSEVESPVQDVEWTVTGYTDSNTQIVTSSGKPILKVGASEAGVLRLTAWSSAYDGLKGTLTLTVRPLAYTVTVTPDGSATGVLPGARQGFTAKLTCNDPALTLPQEFTWTLDGVYVSGTAITAAEDTGKASLAVAKLETAKTITVKATPKDAAYSTLSGKATIPVPKVIYTVDIQDSDGASVTGGTVTIKDAQSATFTKAVTSYPTDQAPTDHWTWTSSNAAGGITVENGVVTVARNTPTDTKSTITVTNSDYSPALEASFEVKVQKVTFTVTPSPSTATVYTSKTQAFTATVTADDGSDPADTVNWTVSGNNDARTKFIGSTLTVGAGETASKLTVKATHIVSGATGTATVTVGKPTFTVDIKKGTTSVKGKTSEVKYGGSATYTLDITSNPTGCTPDGTWRWSSATTANATVAATSDDTTQATVTTSSGATVGKTSVITVQNSADPTLKATFTVEVQWETMTVDGVEYIVLLKDVTVNGKVGSEMSATNHKAALLLTKDVQSMRKFDASSNKWMNSDIREYLNGTDGENWLADKPNTQSKAIKVSIKTRQHINSDSFDTTEDKVFLLSTADVSGQYYKVDSWLACSNEEYIYNNARIPCFAEGGGTLDTNRLGKDSGDTVQSWWLRTPFRNDKNVAFVNGSGNINDGDCGSSAVGVRPAFWYNLDE